MSDNLHQLLMERGVDISAGAVLMRHKSKKYPQMQQHLGTRAFELYQSVQDFQLAPGSYVVGSYGYAPSRALLTGIWRVDESIDAIVAKEQGLLQGSFETLETFGRYYNKTTELHILDDLLFHLAIEWKGMRWNRNLQQGTQYPIALLNECPIPIDKLPAVALERIETSRKLRTGGEVDALADEAVLKQLALDPAFRALPETTRMAIVESRRGQGRFRDGVIDHWAGCAVTGCALTPALIASHIVPWRIASHADRIDPFNGLLLTPNIDKLFDKYLISFGKEGELLVSRALDRSDLAALGVSADLKLLRTDARREKFLVQHREAFVAKERASSRTA